MTYAIVKFLDDGDSPGVVCINWIIEDGKTCYYPNVRTDEARDRLLRKQVPASVDWPKWRIKVLHRYETFNDARQHLKRAEETSNLDSEEEEDDYYPRKRRRCQDTDNLDDPVHSFPKRIEIEPLPRPPSAMSAHFSQSPDLYHHCQPTSPYASPPTSCHSLFLQSVPSTSRHSPSPVASTSSYFPDRTIMVPPVPMPRTSILPPVRSEGCQDCCRKYASQAGRLTVWMTEVVKRLDSLESHILSNKQSPVEEENNENVALVGMLPITDDVALISLNAKIAEDSGFRQLLAKILISVGGKEIRSLVYNMLRRVMDDAVAELYSLSGKSSSTKIPPKKQFLKTEICKLLFSSCQKVFPGATELQIKEAIGDWLHQAKVRKNRRLNRLKSKDNQEPSELE